MISMTLPIYSNNIRYVPPPPLKQLEPPRKYTIKNTKPECMQEKVHIPLCRGEMILFIKDTFGKICLLIHNQTIEHLSTVFLRVLVLWLFLVCLFLLLQFVIIVVNIRIIAL